MPIFYTKLVYTNFTTVDPGLRGSAHPQED